MKVVIWGIACFVFAVLNYLTSGIKLYANETYLTDNQILVEGVFSGLRVFVIAAVCFYIARSVSKKWDAKEDKKRVNKLTQKAQAEGLSLRQYIYKDLPKEVEETCEFYRGNSKELDKYLGRLLENEDISYDVYQYLYDEYS